jgi:hypothetical protein
VFQALAQLGRLVGVDYISTGSGGGHFGSFLGRLYQRRKIENAEEVRRLLDPTAPSAQRPALIPDVIAWLRENGRYLSPNGASDLLIGAAIMLRSWVTIQVVVLSRRSPVGKLPDARLPYRSGRVRNRRAGRDRPDQRSAEPGRSDLRVGGEEGPP